MPITAGKIESQMLLLQLAFNFFLFILGMSEIFLNRQHYLFVLICIEIILLSINLSFLVVALQLNDFVGFIYAFFILAVAAAEAAIGLAIMILYYKAKGNIFVSSIFSLKS